MMQSVIVIGGGLGGVSAAIRMAQHAFNCLNKIIILEGNLID